MANSNLPQYQTMYDLTWKHRVLVTQVTTETELKELQNDIGYYYEDTQVRKIILLVQFKNNTYTLVPAAPNTFTQQQTSVSLSKEVAKMLSENHRKTLLIGLDGGIKSDYATKSFRLQQAFQDIDLMPMRRFELNR